MILNVLVVLIFFVFTLIYRFTYGYLSSPAGLLILIFLTLFLFSPLSKNTDPFGLYVLMSFVFTFSIGAFIVRMVYLKSKMRVTLKKKKIIKKKDLVLELKILSILGFLSGFLGLFIFLKSASVSLSDLLSFPQLLLISHKLSVLRYEDVLRPPLVSNILFSFAYFSCIIGGFFQKELGRLFSLLVLTVFLCYAIVYTTKAVFLWALILWISGFFARKILETDRFYKLPYKLLFLIFPIILLMAIFATYLRTAGKLDIVGSLEKLEVYAFGNITPFTYWVSHEYNNILSLTFGRNTFNGFFSLLGLVKRVPGIFDEYIMVISGEVSNIYTVFRFFIEDLSLPGAYILTFLLGFLSEISYLKVYRGGLFYIPLLVMFYLMVLWSPFASALAYNSLNFSMLVFFVYIVLLNIRRKLRVVHS